MGQHVIGIKLYDPLRHYDGLIKAAQVLINARQPVHGVSEIGVECQRLLVLSQGLLLLALGKEIERCEVVLLSPEALGFVLCFARIYQPAPILACEKRVIGDRPNPTLYSLKQSMLKFLWNATRGHHLAPWRSPYLRWRIETYCGIKMQKIGFLEFWLFMWRERLNLLRFLRWADEMERQARPRTGPIS